MRLLVCIDTGDLSHTIIPQADRLAEACGAEVSCTYSIIAEVLPEKSDASTTSGEHSG